MKKNSKQIAVIGISARFPGSNSWQEFWNNLVDKKESITFFEEKKENYVNAKPFIEDATSFDAEFFKISGKEAALMDPQHRLLLQSAWHAFEDAGYRPDQMLGNVGVFATSNFNTYQHVDGWFSSYWKQMEDKPAARFSAYTGNIQDTLATKISYKLNLKGPSITVQTACSGALVAIHLACQSILSGESDLALAGACALSFPDQVGYVAEEGMILSKNGHCKAFDKDASGTIFGNGVACVLLKPLDQAIRDNDHIYGVICGSAINNDGSRKVDFNAPSVIGQKEVIQSAHKAAGVSPDQIAYIEAHGTGTIVGDPIEIEALKAAFGKTSSRCGIGTVKTNIGHLDAASGMAGFIKALLCLKYEKIPATLHFKNLNPLIDLKNSPFYIVDTEITWKRSKQKRFCAITSLGIGGTNAHMILKEAPARKLISEQKGPKIILFSAETLEQLQEYIKNLLACLNKDLSIADVAYTLSTSRIPKKYKCMGEVSSIAELKKELIALKNGKESTLKITTEAKEVSLIGNRISLPGYPFAKDTYWFDQVFAPQTEQIDATMSFVRDHVIDGKCLFPAAAYLAFAYQNYSHKTQGVVFENVSFKQPLIVDSPKNLKMNWKGDSFEFVTNVIHAQGSAKVIPMETQSLDIQSLLKSSIPCGDPYPHFEKQGIQYGSSFQRIRDLSTTHQKVIAKIAHTVTKLGLAPQMIDAALQAAIGMSYLPGSKIKASDGFIPFLIQKAIFYRPITSDLYVVLTPQSESFEMISYDVTAYTPEGIAVFSLEGVKETRIQASSLKDDFLSWFARAIGKETVDPKAPLETYNIDSVLAISLADEISKKFCPCSKSIFFEFYTLEDLFKSLSPQIKEKETAATSSAEEFAVAVVGLSGTYPKSSSIQELWEHLLKGDNLVTEIPKDRWDHSQYFSKEPGILGKTYSQWGGFLKSIDMFDPLFFKISPREASLLDPQERLFLQCAWHTLEDAGYTPKALADHTDHAVGVYVGAMYQEQQLYGIEERMKGNPVIINGIMSTIPNRVSYFCDFRGPSLAVDTMCSSSLTALNLAFQDLKLGNTKAALVGGVNITPHPNKYLQLSQERILADDGLCKSFGPGGTGYVPSEGIGCVLIKPLHEAVKDRDHIYGVIRGVQLNHGGKTNSFTVPNAQAQAAVIQKTLQTSGLSPQKISYVEAHGTGTALGDPIEIRALTEAFGASPTQSCAIGSIKSNIGHTESNAGIAGLTKILLQMKYKTLVPSIHSEILNPNIDFSKTPFKVQKEVEPWTCPTRIAALSSFGAGGSNAHAIIEEYPLKKSSSPQKPVPILLSAKSSQALRTIAQNLESHLKKEELSLLDVAYTLAVGRVAFPFKAAFMAISKVECLRLLSCIANEEGAPEISFTHQNPTGPDMVEAWTGGAEINWEKFYEKESVSKVSLPTYPFEEINCRFTSVVKKEHSLVHENVSTPEETTFQCHLHKNITLIQDHKLGSQTLLPGAAYIEMALFAFKNSSLQISWVKPLYLSEKPQVVRLSIIGNHFEIWSEEKIFCQGMFTPEKNTPMGRPLVSWENCTHTYSKEICYKKLKSFQFDYGPSYQTIVRAAISGKEVLAEALLNESFSLEDCILHPMLMDAAFQSTAVFDFEKNSNDTFVPASISSLQTFAPLSRKITIHACLQEEKADARKYDIFLYNNQNQLSVEIIGFIEKPLYQRKAPKETSSKTEVSAWLRTTLAQLLNIPSDQLTAERSFEDLGVDSVLSMNLISHLEKEVGTLPKTLFFEYPTMSELSDYFQENTKISLPEPVAIPESNIVSLRKKETPTPPSPGPIDIAIIGIAGKYPQSDTLEELWSHLVKGNSCIEEIPENRFEYKTIFEPYTTEAGKTKGKWGGFLKDIFSFDPLFFKLSTFDAERSDPQEKLFCQAVWHAMEDAGYSRDRLAKISEKAVGVYVGTMYQEYQLYNSEQILLGNPLILEASASTIANRISYFLNLTGPSLAIDTMCSSSLTAIYLACNDLILGKCKMAIAGGVNVTVHRNKYLALSYQGFLSTNGLCKSFGKGGDGYVPSEGVGAVILKPLAEAIKDRDQIYGVIKGIDINHGGKAGGFTVPSAPAQAQAIQTALKQSQIKPDEITYIEAHGTGTALGDPIEISGLNQVFSSVQKKIPVGSIKSNIGHTEAAAGLAALTKVLLQMKHQTLVASIHNDPPNPYIDFKSVPFTIQNTMTSWTGNRTALISSFGAGGSNSATVIQEYAFNKVPPQTHKLTQLFVLSALNQERLKNYAENFLAYFQTQNSKNFSLTECMYTLQIGRDAFSNRLAICFENFEDLLKKLQEYLSGKTNPAIFTSSSQNFSAMLENIGVQEEFQEFIQKQISSYPVQKLAKLWTQGTPIDWESLYNGAQIQVMSLPPYPFASVRCWATINPLTSGLVASAKNHPLVHENTSDLSGLRFTSHFGQTEPLLRDHNVQGALLLPGAAILEMAISAAKQVSDSIVFQVENMLWLRPLILENKLLTTHVKITPQNQKLNITILNEKEELCSECSLQILEQEYPLGNLDIHSIQKELPLQIENQEIYTRFQEEGFKFGPTFKTIRRISYSSDTLLAEVELPSEAHQYSNCAVNPYWVDAMLQTTLALATGEGNSIPFRIGKFTFRSIPETKCFVYGKRSGNGYDLFLLNQQGEILIALNQFEDRPIHRQKEDPLEQVLKLLANQECSVEEAETMITLLSE